MDYSRFDFRNKQPHIDLDNLRKKIVKACVICSGYGHVNGVQCTCLTEMLSICGLDKANVPREYWEYKLNNFKCDVTFKNKIISAVNAYKISTSNWLQMNWLFCGPYRTGKTTLAICLLKEWLSNNDTSQCCYLTARDLLTVARSRDPEKDLEWLAQSDLVIIDELGKEAPDEWDKLKFVGTLDAIIRMRRGSRATLMLSNLYLEKLAMLYGENILFMLKNDFNIQSFEHFERLNVK